jgi:hypothetical protein
MPEVSALDEWAARIDELAVAVADATMREAGLLQPPVVHILAEGSSPPYLGYLTCRPFVRGEDAGAAVAALGALPSALAASRLVITWEHADLCTALETPGAEAASTGVVVVDADWSGHVLRWHPMQVHAGDIGELQIPTVVPEWGPTQSFRDAPLPGPVIDLLAVWRTARDWTEVQIADICDNLAAAGYEMRWLDLDGAPDKHTG